MKILIYTDTHFCEFSSIVRSQGNNYSTRLENEIKSISWAESLVDKYGCDKVIHLGDFFDKPELNSAEISALREIKFSNVEHILLVGNHESVNSNLSTTTLDVFREFKVIKKPSYLVCGSTRLDLIPYMTNIKEDLDYLDDVVTKGGSLGITKKIALSHNDIAGINYGAFISEQGIDLDYIDKTWDLFLNGHLHNTCWVTNKLLNVGNLTGQNFSEDASIYKHNAVILDTDTLEVLEIENPYAFNFYKIEVHSESELYKLDNLKSNAVVSVVTYSRLMQQVKDKLIGTISRVVIKPEPITRIEKGIQEESIDLSINPIEKLIQFAREKLEPSKILEEELKELNK
jgi:calcineurin-like phosphoesterase family protein